MYFAGSFFLFNLVRTHLNSPGGKENRNLFSEKITIISKTTISKQRARVFIIQLSPAPSVISVKFFTRTDFVSIFNCYYTDFSFSFFFVIEWYISIKRGLPRKQCYEKGLWVGFSLIFPPRMPANIYINRVSCLFFFCLLLFAFYLNTRSR